MIRKLAFIAALILLFSSGAFAQSTTVSGTITDTPDGQAWFGGTYSLVFRVSPSNPTAQYFWNGVPFSSAQTIAGALDGSAHYSVSVPSNTSITPAGSTWDVTFCPLATAACLTVQSVSVTGTTQTFSPSPPSVRINMGSPAPNTRAYRDGELVNGALGQAYFNVTDTLIHVCNTLPCTVWTPINFGGVVNVITAPSGTCTPGSVPEQVISTGVIYTCQASVWAPIASSGAAAGTTGQYQLNNAGVLGVGNLSESGGTLTNGDNNSNRGPNPNVDATFFGAQVVNLNTVPQTTGTISASSSSLSVSSATGFGVNIAGVFPGLDVINAGPTNCGTAPAAPTGVPALPSSPTGLGHYVAGATGSTSVSYVVAAISQGGCVTASSPVLTISNSSNSMGPVSLAVTSQSISLQTVTVTVGSTAGVASGFRGWLFGTSDDGEFGGFHEFTVVDGTHLSYKTGISSLYFMTAASATGGTINTFNENALTLPSLPAGTNMFKEAVYRCTAGAGSCAMPANQANYSLVYVSYPLNLGWTSSTYGIWEDYGTTMSPTAFKADWFIPTTPPTTNTNDMLVSLITAEVGTTFTLATPATNSSGAGVAVRFDNWPAMLATQNAANNSASTGGGTPYLAPAHVISAGLPCYAISSYAVMSKTWSVGNPLCSFATVVLPGDMEGVPANSLYATSAGTNAIGSAIPLYCNAMPCFIRNNGIIRNVVMTSSSNPALVVFDISGGATLAENLSCATNGGSADYNGICYYYWNDTPGTGQFGGRFTNWSMITGPASPGGFTTTTPGFVSKNGGYWYFDYMSGYARGYALECNSANVACSWDDIFKMGEEIQGLMTPMFSFANWGGGNRGGRGIEIDQTTNDSGSTPYFEDYSPTTATNGAPVFLNTLQCPGANQPIITGEPWLGSITMINNGCAIYSHLGNNTTVTVLGGVGSNSTNVGLRTTGINQNIGSGTGNHTLVANEGGWVSTGTGTITVDCTLAGQRWAVHSQTGTTTLACNSGTLYGNNSTGSFVIPNGSGVVVDVDNSGNAHATGGGGGSGGCSPGGITDALQYNGGGTCSFGGLNAPVVAGDYIVHYPTPTSAAVAPARDLAGIPVNPQTGTTYVEGSANYQCDRGFLVTASNAGAQTYTMVNPSTACFAQNYFSLLDNIGAGDVTENASGFTVNGGASLVTPSGWERFLYSNGVNYSAAVVPTAAAFPPCPDTGGNHLNRDSGGHIICGTSASGNGLSGMTAGQVPIAATATSVTSSEALAGAGAAITTGPASSTSGDVVDFIGTGGQIADAGFLASNVWRKDAANISAAVNHDFSAGTWKFPAGAGATASATSNCILDTTNKNLHCYMNNADAIALGITSAPTTGDLFDSSVSSGNVLAHDSGIATANVTTQTSNGASGQVCTYTGANKICVPGSVTATQLAAQYSKGACTEVWGGSGTSFALTAGDDAISNNTCYNDSGVTRTITAVKCRSDNASNTTTVNPTFGSAGTGTTILSGALTCGNSYAYSSSGTVSNASWTTGTGIDPVMGGTLTGTSIAVIIEFTF